VDHGKTELVGRLTGWNTDRLKEEQERGISIELGFAPLPLDSETMIGVVDVPGHERFVKQMVAGACGIDLAMLLVAADEGVMPQTKEHLEVLRSLHIATGVIVISKVDLATEEMLSIVKEELGDLVKGTFLENAPIIETSAKTGEGIDTLKRTLLDLTRRIEQRGSSGPFRLAVDRVFHIQGIGVVITGSGYSGSVSVGDSLELLPSRKTVRVREIESFGEKREKGFAGERLAIALQGAKLEEVSRGDMLVTPSAFATSSVFDARVHLAGYASFEMKHRERVRVHHGAMEVLGRVVLLEGDVLHSGESGLVQLKLESPIVASEGDYFILRKYSPTRVLGGGRVVDPCAPRHRRRDPAVLENLRLRESGGPTEKLLQTVEAAGLLGKKEESVDTDAAKALGREGRIVIIDGVIFARSALSALADRLGALAAEYAATHPLRYGIDKEELRQKVRFPHPTPLFNDVLEELSKTNPLFVKDNRVRAGTRTVELEQGLAQEIDRLEAVVRKAGLLFPNVTDLESGWRGRSPLQDALQFLKENGRIVRVGDAGYVHAEAFEACVQTLRGWFEGHEDLAVGDLKELFGVTRKHAIPLLEYLDRMGITIRSGNVRRRGPDLGK
jgi:selenocysteine-specific elongation factor